MSAGSCLVPQHMEKSTRRQNNHQVDSLQADGDEYRQQFSPSAYGEVHEEEPHVQSHVHVVGVAGQ